MSSSRHRIRETAGSIMVECGPFARMAALFLAREAQEAGDPAGELHWTRVAQAILEMEGQPPRPDMRRLH